jgi:hypothetical protein
MKSATDNDVKTNRFWVRHPDSTQAAVHLALQWLAFVYPTSGMHLDATLRQALPYADDELNSLWRDFLEEKDVDDHVEALRWLSSTLSNEQLPFLIESCWRLLLVNHDLPSHVPLALRLLGRVLNVPEFHILDIGKQVQSEIDQPPESQSSPLLPEDPRYLDRVEWRLYGMSDPIRRTSYAGGNGTRRWIPVVAAFTVGLLVGAGSVSYLVWGPPQWGREPVPRMSHQSSTNATLVAAEQAPVAADTQDSAEAEVDVFVGTLDQSTLPEAVTGDAEALAETTEPELSPDKEASSDRGPDADTELRVLGDSEGNRAEAAIDESAPAPDETDTVSQSETVPGQPDVMMRITASVLNVRAAPATEADIIIKLGEGARVWMEPGGAEGSWNRIRVEGLTGYASSDFMEPVN